MAIQGHQEFIIARTFFSKNRKCYYLTSWISSMLAINMKLISTFEKSKYWRLISLGKFGRKDALHKRISMHGLDNDSSGQAWDQLSKSHLADVQILSNNSVHPPMLQSPHFSYCWYKVRRYKTVKNSLKLSRFGEHFPSQQYVWLFMYI